MGNGIRIIRDVLPYCMPCRMGKKQNCEYLFALGVNLNGGFAEYSVCPDTQCFKVRDDLDFDVAAMAEPLACAVHGIDQAGIVPGQVVVTTKLVEINKGCLAHLVSDDGNCWREMEPIYMAPDDNEPECSDYFYVNGRYYLIFSHYARAQYRISDQPFTDWKMPANSAIPCHSVPKAAIWKRRIIFAGFENNNNYAGTMTFIEAEPDEKGELRYFSVKYEN